MLLIGKRIKELRKEKEITQSELASALNMSDRTVSKWEQGKGYPDIETLPVLSKYFNVSIDYLMMGEDFRSNSNTSNSEIVINYFNSLISPFKLNEYCERFISKHIAQFEVEELKDAIDVFYTSYIKNRKDDVVTYIQNEIPKLIGIAKNAKAEPEEKEINHIINVLNKRDPDYYYLNSQLKKLIKNYLDLTSQKDDPKRIEYLRKMRNTVLENNGFTTTSFYSAYNTLVNDIKKKRAREKRINNGFVRLKECDIDSLEELIQCLNNSIKEGKINEIFQNSISILDLLIKKATVAIDNKVDESCIPHISKFVDDLYLIFGSYLGKKNCRDFAYFYNHFSKSKATTRVPYKELDSFSYFIETIQQKINKRIRSGRSSNKPIISKLMSYK